MSLPRPLKPADTLDGILAAATALKKPSHAIIGGREVLARSGRTFDNIAPRDGSLINRLPAGNEADIDAAVASARQAFDSGVWRDMAPKARKKVLHALADLMESHAENLALLESLDTGKPIRDARSVDIQLAIGTVRYYAEAVDKMYGEVAPTPSDRLSYAVHEPLGVIGAIVPWNFPLHMAMWKVAPALAVGNSVVLKPAELASMTTLYTAKLALEAGVPPGVWNVVPGLGMEAGHALAIHMDVDMITFTGSGRTGRALMQASADSNLKRVALELGGKSPQIVFADCDDLDTAAENAAWGLFYNQGQVCTAASRLLVEDRIKADFVRRVANVAARIEVGDPFDPETRFGAMISERQMNTSLGYIERGQAEGGRLLLGGGRARAESGGFYVEPSLIDDVTGDNILAQEEVFGPVLAVQSFEDEAEAYKIANGTIYGLASGVWTSNINRAMRAVKAMKAGLVWVNGWDACDITSPFGGVKQSGFGRDRSLHAMAKYADLKAVSISFKG